jgi:hypothetical protein
MNSINEKIHVGLFSQREIRAELLNHMKIKVWNQVVRGIRFPVKEQCDQFIDEIYLQLEETYER